MGIGSTAEESGSIVERIGWTPERIGSKFVAPGSTPVGTDSIAVEFGSKPGEFGSRLEEFELGRHLQLGRNLRLGKQLNKRFMIPSLIWYLRSGLYWAAAMAMKKAANFIFSFFFELFLRLSQSSMIRKTIRLSL